MKLSLEISMDNEAFTDDPGLEAARILRRLAERLDGVNLSEGDAFRLMDINGNGVGEAIVE